MTAVATERLVLRKPRPDDAPGLLDAYADVEVVRYISDGSTATLAEVEEGIEQWLERWEEWGLGFFSLERRDDGRVLGRAGFVRWDPETWQVGGTETELGWLLARKHWGHGYATEAALALRDWALGERRLSRLVSLIQHENVRSIRVAEKLGERYERDVEVRGKPTRLYSLERR
ncbi:MAG: GNAT family N-acetyltransferase [Gaiellaceae bacterium]